MEVFLKNAAPFIPAIALVFQAGRQSERLDELFTKTYALEREQRGNNELLFEIHGKVNSIEKYLHSAILHSNTPATQPPSPHPPLP